MDNWINIKDRLPEKEGFYLLSTGYRPFVGFYKTYKNHKSFITSDGTHSIITNVKFWITMPEISNESKEVNIANSTSSLKKHITDKELTFLLQVLSDSITLGENEVFRYQVVTRKAMETNLTRKSIRD